MPQAEQFLRNGQKLHKRDDGGGLGPTQIRDKRPHISTSQSQKSP